MLNIEDSNTLTEIYNPLAEVFRALAHPARLAILDLLREGEACVCHIEATLGLRQAYVSQQLMLLRQSGLVSMRRQGWNVFYRVSDPRIFEVLEQARSLLPAPLPALPRTETLQCTCPRCRVGSKPA